VGSGLVRRRDQIQEVRAGFDGAERLPEIMDQIAEQFLGARNGRRLHIFGSKDEPV
jgi:hypothetical protein